MHLREFFYLQKSDRSVLLFLLGLLLAGASLFFFFGGNGAKTTLTAADSIASGNDSISRRRHSDNHRDYPYVEPRYYRTDDGRSAELFAFDPNTADSTQLLRLGLQPWQVRNIYKYRAKGGIYRTPEDFARVYGLTRKQYNDMRPYIQISDDYAPAADFVGSSRPNFNETKTDEPKYNRDTVKFPVKIHEGQFVDIVIADTSQLKKVPGIGSYWARQIVKYRERLGGYVSTKQLLEIEAFPDEALKYLKVESPHVEKLNVNTLSLNQLRRHPYINFYQAREICDYRRLKGRITDLNQLSLLKDFPPEQIERLRPYVAY